MPRRASEVSIDSLHTGERLDKALTSLLAVQGQAQSRARVQALLAEGCITQSGKAVTEASRKTKAGEVFSVRLPAPRAAVPKAQKRALNIVYEDKDVIVIDKPVGLVVHPAPGHYDRTLVNALLAHCGKSLSGIGGVARPGIVHRLDKDTSGLIVIAKNDAAHQALSAQFADRSLSRTYHALVEGVPVPRAGRVEGAIGRHARDRKKMAVTAKGKPALTYYNVLEVFSPAVTPAKAGVPFGKNKNGMLASAGMTNASLIECKLATGRTHQIRVHLAHIKHPVLGDTVYGKRRAPTDALYFPRQALHAAELQFRHPRTQKTMRFASAMPTDMQKLLKRLRAKAA